MSYEYLEHHGVKGQRWGVRRKTYKAAKTKVKAQTDVAKYGSKKKAIASIQKKNKISRNVKKGALFIATAASTSSTAWNVYASAHLLSGAAFIASTPPIGISAMLGSTAVSAVTSAGLGAAAIKYKTNKNSKRTQKRIDAIKKA